MFRTTVKLRTDTCKECIVRPCEMCGEQRGQLDTSFQLAYNTPLSSLKNSGKLFYTPLNAPLGYLQRLFQAVEL